jgi:hypothetical protein
MRAKRVKEIRKYVKHQFGGQASKAQIKYFVQKMKVKYNDRQL